MSNLQKICSTTKIQKNSMYKIKCFLLFNISIDNLYIVGGIVLAKIVIEKIKNKIRTFEPEIGETIKNTQAEI